LFLFDNENRLFSGYYGYSGDLPIGIRLVKCALFFSGLKKKHRADPDHQPDLEDPVDPFLPVIFSLALDRH
jgi:hypothetical protein